MIDATHLKVHRTAASLLKKGRYPLLAGGRPDEATRRVRWHRQAGVVTRLLTAGQTSDYTGARTPAPSLPQAQYLIADRWYDANWLIA